MNVHPLKIGFETADGEVPQHWRPPNPTNPVSDTIYQKKAVAIALLEDDKLINTAAIAIAESPTWQPERRSEQITMES